MIKRIYRIIRGKLNYTSDEFIYYLKKKGVKIGKGTRFFSPDEISIDLQHPSMLTIGNNVRITKGVSILCHDYSWSVCATIDGEVFSNIGKVTIGNNVFIGINSVILKGSTICDNVIIGANSVVSGLLEEGYVYAGNPCKKIASIAEYKEKRIKNQLKELEIYILNYKETFNDFPPENKLTEYLFLYKNKLSELNKNEIDFLNRIGNDYIISNFENHCSVFKNYNDLKSYFIAKFW